MSAAVRNVFLPITRGRGTKISSVSLSHKNYRADIDGLRALAILPVIIFHAFPAIMPGGFIGVDIFFVISGYLISNILLQSLQRDAFSFGHFYSNRIKRIFPALLVVLAFCLVFGWFFLLPDEFAQLGKHIVGAAGYAENFVLRREAGYFDSRSALKPLMHLWSLGIEEQFYITYPLFLWILWRLRLNLFGLLSSIALASFCLNIWQVQHDPVGAFFLPQTRCWELLLGGSIACWQTKKIPLVHDQDLRWSARPGGNLFSAQVLRNLSSLTGLALILAAVFLIHEGDPFPGWRALLPASGAGLLIAGGPKSWINRRILSNKTLVFIGLISYALYLWHWPVLAFPRILHGGEISVSLRLGGMLLSFGLAWVTWRFIENPLRFGPMRFKIMTLTSLSIAIGIAGYITHSRGGFDSRFPQLTKDLGSSHPEQFASEECRKTVGLSNIAYCRARVEGPPDVLLIGDSHAATLYRGLAPEYQKRLQILMNLGQPGCVPFFDTESFTGGIRQDPPCMPVMNRILDFALETSRARTIILALRGPANMLGHGFGLFSTSPLQEVRWAGATTSSSPAETFSASFSNTVSRLYASGKTITLFIDWPELDFDPRSCLPRPISFFTHPRSLCGVPRGQVDARNRQYRDVVEQLKTKFPGVRVFDPLPYLCDGSVCYAMKNGHLLYSDDNHLSAVGSAYLARNFLEQMQLTSQLATAGSALSPTD
jgi:peptidoglycan/LPS O-acetylase OafA/YrhL